MATLTGIAERFTSWWKTANATQRALVVGGGAAAILSISLVVLWSSQPDFVVLFSGLDPEDAGAIIEELDETEVPYRANIYALKSLGVEWIIGINAVGSLKAEIKPGDLVIPDQLIDRTQSRTSSFFRDGIVAHILFADPFCALDIVDQSNVARALENGIEKIARRHGCSAVHTAISSSGSQRDDGWLCSVLHERGHRIEGLHLCKLIPA